MYSNFLINKLILALTIWLILTNTSYSQHNDYKYTEATILTANNEKINGRIKNILTGGKKYELQMENGESLILEPEQIKEIVTQNNKFISDGNKFYQVSIEGSHVSLYIINMLSTGPNSGPNGAYTVGPPKTSEVYYIRKASGEIQKLEKIGFRKKYMEYFKDCPRVVDRIKSKALGPDQIWVIVNLYNSCLEKNSN